MALQDNNLLQNQNLEEPFFDWVANKLGYYESTAGWANMILASTLGLNPQKPEWEKFLTTEVSWEQHETSLRKFYELLEEYMHDEKIIELYKLIK